MSVKKAIQDIVIWRGLNFLSVFILNILVARSFEASQAGELFFFINNLSLVILVLSFSLESGLLYYGAAGKISEGRLGLFALLWCIATSLISFLLFDPIEIYLSPLNEINSKIAAIFFIAGSLLTSFFSSLYFTKENFIVPNIWPLIINITLIVFFIGGMQEKITMQWLLYAYFGGFLLQGLLVALFYFFGNKSKTVKNTFTSDSEKIIKYSSTVFLSNIVFFLVYRIDYWFVEKYCTAQELGNYIQVSKIVQWLLLVPMMISTVVFPLTAMRKDNDMAAKIIRLSRLLLWLYFFGCAIISITGYWLFIWLFGETYNYMYPVFLLHIPGILALASLYPLSSYNAGIKRADINLLGSLLALAVIIVLNALFTPAYGIYAASITSSIGYTVYFLFSFYKFNRQNKITLYEIFKPAASDYTLLKSALYRRK